MCSKLSSIHELWLQDAWPLTSRALWKVCYYYIACTSFEVKMRVISRILKHGRWIALREIPRLNDPLGSWLIAIQGSDAQENALNSPPPQKKRPLTNQMYLEMSRMLVWSTGWEQLNKWACPQILMSNVQNHNRLVTLHLSM